MCAAAPDRGLPGVRQPAYAQQPSIPLAGRPLLITLIARGDLVAVDRGRLLIRPASGKPAPQSWIRQRRLELLAEIERLTGTPLLEYLGYVVGNYGRHRAGGVTLQFRALVTDDRYFTIFNVNTRRARTTRYGHAGASLPEGQFRVDRQGLFVRFWQSTGLPEPRRPSAYHECMSKLEALIFTAAIAKGEQLEKTSLRPFTISGEALIRLAGATDKCPTTFRHRPDNVPTRVTDKDSAATQQPQGLQPISATGENQRGTTVIRNDGTKGSYTPLPVQTREEWDADYDGFTE
jgi:hypothetical protein